MRLEMIKLMRPVIDFLNRLDAEKGQEMSDDKPLESLVKVAMPKELKEIGQRSLFLAPQPTKQKLAPETARIQYSRPLREVRKAQKALKVRSLREVGEKTFDYFYERECQN